ncbi:MAG: hypothetical protein COU90_00140 [Candidatus Ryanbacteria bacterium CG10_big_fil_rev_8_21_14_0_10_43_42]|uniref:Uncharacterized protein n=1 Tax=Candidatus Ryanbacteria bacterium CG10_big_fil_rev_8_21_14_0_10_43_42 TaxID=1974864 RepID=A0A2M8KYA6_9BACT|nr:MAG: hypothetical protein COU90_00140 [Candidatus Ryanbacteria bacterium CG10_big_fil_rev_8_21_14_0_10_43_42]
MADANEERVQGFLFGFVDFLYAVLFGVILQQTFTNVLLITTIPRPEKLVRILLVVGVASFLWYWYVGQLLSFGGMAMLYVIGWLYDLSYELFAPSREGLAGGPAVPFVSDRSIVRLRRFLRIPA